MKKLTLASAALLVCGFAYAQTQMPHVDQRQAQQQARIQQGVASGELTHKEAARLEKQQAHIAKAETRAESDGKVTRQERRRLHNKQDHASRAIYRQKHDKQDRH